MTDASIKRQLARGIAVLFLAVACVYSALLNTAAADSGSAAARSELTAAKQALAAGEQRAALIHYKKALRADASLAEAQAGLAVIYELRRQTTAAASAAAAALALDPDQLDALLVSARLASRDGDNAAAIGFYQRVLLIAPNNIYAQTGLLQSYQASGQQAQAERAADAFEQD